MKKNQCLTVILALVMMLSCFGVNVSAAEECLGAEETISVVRATGKFDMEVRANRTVKAGSSFPLEVGEVVTIQGNVLSVFRKCRLWADRARRPVLRPEYDNREF